MKKYVCCALIVFIFHSGFSQQSVSPGKIKLPQVRPSGYGGLNICFSKNSHFYLGRYIGAQFILNQKNFITLEYGEQMWWLLELKYPEKENLALLQYNFECSFGRALISSDDNSFQLSVHSGIRTQKIEWQGKYLSTRGGGWFSSEQKIYEHSVIKSIAVPFKLRYMFQSRYCGLAIDLYANLSAYPDFGLRSAFFLGRLNRNKN
jgi:hypothetical protein